MEMPARCVPGSAAGEEDPGPILGMEARPVELIECNGGDGGDARPVEDGRRRETSGEAEIAVGLNGFKLGGEEATGELVKLTVGEGLWR